MREGDRDDLSEDVQLFQVGQNAHASHGSAVAQAGRDVRFSVEHHLHQAPVGDQVNRWVFGIVPPRAGAFQDRRITADLFAAVASCGTAVLTGAGSRVLAGPGGVGKTQIATEYARRLWFDDRVDLLMWVGATTRDAITSAFGRAAAVVDGAAEPDARQAAERWLEYLATTGKRWLVVLDDLQDPADVRGLWPPHTPTGQVVVTTRRRDAALAGDGRRVVEVGLFTEQEAVAFLRQRLAEHPAQADGAPELAAELGYLPVALAQAAAYIADHSTLSCASYRLRWTDRRRTPAQVLPAEGELPDDHRATLATTWSLSIDLADGLEPAGLARPLLEVASLLDPNGFPESVLTASATLDHLGTASGRPVDRDTATDALSCLHRLSLITHASDDLHRPVRVHALVQRAIREGLPPEELAADALAQVWPDVECGTDVAPMLRTNTEVLCSVADSALWDPGAHPVLFRTGNSLGKSGQVQAAADYFERLSTTAEQRLGTDHAHTLATRHTLAHWRGRLGDAVGAVAVLRQVAADRARVLGADHPDTLNSSHSLASWLGESGDVAGAVAILEVVWADRARVLGVDHSRTLAARHSLARWRGEAGDAVGAAAALKRVLADCLRVLGADHPHTLATRHSLARWRGEAGDAAGAAEAFGQVSEDRVRVLGPDHPDTLAARHSLASWRGEAGDAGGAAAALERVLADRTRVLGADHPDTLSAAYNLGWWRGAAGDAVGAVAALRQVVVDHERVLGVDHPHTSTARQGLVHWLEVSGGREVVAREC